MLMIELQKYQCKSSIGVFGGGELAVYRIATGSGWVGAEYFLFGSRDRFVRCVLFRAHFHAFCESCCAFCPLFLCSSIRPSLFLHSFSLSPTHFEPPKWNSPPLPPALLSCPMRWNANARTTTALKRKVIMRSAEDNTLFKKSIRLAIYIEWMELVAADKKKQCTEQLVSSIGWLLQCRVTAQRRRRDLFLAWFLHSGWLHQIYASIVDCCWKRKASLLVLYIFEESMVYFYFFKKSKSIILNKSAYAYTYVFLLDKLVWSIDCVHRL